MAATLRGFRGISFVTFSLAEAARGTGSQESSEFSVNISARVVSTQSVQSRYRRVYRGLETCRRVLELGRVLMWSGNRKYLPVKL